MPSANILLIRKCHNIVEMWSWVSQLGQHISMFQANYCIISGDKVFGQKINILITAGPIRSQYYPSHDSIGQSEQRWRYDIFGWDGAREDWLSASQQFRLSCHSLRSQQILIILHLYHFLEKIFIQDIYCRRLQFIRGLFQPPQV